MLSILIAGRSYRVVLEGDVLPGDGSDPAIFWEGKRLPYRVEDQRSLKTRRAHTGGAEAFRHLRELRVVQVDPDQPIAVILLLHAPDIAVGAVGEMPDPWKIMLPPRVRGLR